MPRKKKSDEPKLGHNGGPLMADQQKQLHGYISEIERQEVMKQEILDDIGMIYSSAKDAGFDTKAMRNLVRIRKADRDKQQKFENALDVYRHALGMLAELPLGQAGLRRAVEAFGAPTELTEEERAQGYTAAFVDKNGGRVAMGLKS